ncbi:MAG: putative proteinB [Anaerocolumna sp.]|jgi:broad specificity phosphatase PhoE|nr:putative proteinB [Anaerocolumna sp.]
MALFYLIRHGHTDYTPCDERGYKGHGRDLASLSERGVQEAESTARDLRLLKAEIIISSPYTRALHGCHYLKSYRNQAFGRDRFS